MKPRQSSENSLRWVIEPLEGREDFIEKRMFGCLAAYLDDRITLVLADTEEPWNGILIPTDRNLHPAIVQEFPSLIAHPLLGKWLYLSQGDPDFEQVSRKIVEYIARGDNRFGVLPPPKKKKQKLRKRRQSRTSRPSQSK